MTETITVTRRKYPDIAAHLPGAFGVVFNSGEVAIVFVGASNSGTGRVAAWVSAHPGIPRTVTRSGNLLLLLAEKHPTIGVVRTLDGCKASAART